MCSSAGGRASGFFDCDKDSLMPSRKEPRTVNNVRPADLQLVAALGGSLMAGYLPNTGTEKSAMDFPELSLVTGAAERMEEHVTIANILRNHNPMIKGLSYGRNESGFNVAKSEVDIFDLERQAFDLVRRLKMNGLVDKWKLILLSVSQYDFGSPICQRETRAETIPASLRKQVIENVLSFLKKKLPRSIVVIIPTWDPRLLIELEHALSSSKPRCSIDEERNWIASFDRYRSTEYEIQSERKFDTHEFTVVVQDFLDSRAEPLKESHRRHVKKLFAPDLLHLSKFGHAMLAMNLWNSLLRPVGTKNSGADITSPKPVLLLCPQPVSAQPLWFLPRELHTLLI
ncbi:hypothetical protein Q1695_002880 [Nippostrongylus brasiliensis]|nr:hypothetical protein Q1695_002880 [Nippostrongylus brasiliensis]